MKLQRLQIYLFFRMPQAGFRVDVPLERRENTKKSSSFEKQSWSFSKGQAGPLHDTGGRGRTDTPVKERDFESRASANSATPAK